MGKPVVVQLWLESERGWGTRPDGYSIHLSEKHRVSYCAKYWDKMPKNEVPDEYSREGGPAFVADVTDEVYEELKSKGGSMRFLDNDYPGRTKGKKKPMNRVVNLLAITALLTCLAPNADARGFGWFFANVKPTGRCMGGREVVASWYHHGRRTANGEAFRPDGLTAAHLRLPFGSNVTVTNPKNGRSVTVRINDRGPYVRGVTIDLARGAARAIGMHSTQYVCMG